MEVRRGGGYIHRLPTIKEHNYTKIFACRKWEEVCEGNVKLHVPSPNSNQLLL